MLHPLRTLAVGLAIVVGLTLASPVDADGPYSEIVVFGDSISDTGNLFLATGGGAAGPPYFPGRFSNGPVWVEVLAGQLGLPAPVPNLLGGSNYAWGGADTGPGLSFFGTPNVASQIEFFLADRGGFVGDELIVVAAGSNDLIWQAPFGPGRIAENLSEHISVLAAGGGRTFLVPNLAPIGQTPLLRGTPDEARVDTLATQVNRLLDEKLDALEERLDITILRLDMAGLVAAMLLFPQDFGLTNVTDPACPGCGIGFPDPDAGDTIVPNPDEYLWWDFMHGTWVVHEIGGQFAANLVLSSAQP